jgi:hypothetical protein
MLKQIAGGLWATDKLDTKLKESGLYVPKEDFQEAAQEIGKIAASGTYAFNQTGMNVSGAYEIDCDPALRSKVFFQLQGVGDVAPELPINLLSTQSIYDMVATYRRNNVCPLGFGLVSLKIVEAVIGEPEEYQPVTEE